VDEELGTAAPPLPDPPGLLVDLVVLVVVVLDEDGMPAPPLVAEVELVVVEEYVSVRAGLGAGAVLVGAPLPPPQPATSRAPMTAAEPRNLRREGFINPSRW
jgi:hypothetical protein